MTETLLINLGSLFIALISGYILFSTFNTWNNNSEIKTLKERIDYLEWTLDLDEEEED